MTAGSDNPPMVKLELLELAPVIVTFAPLALRLPDAVPLAPSNTLPIARFAGVALNCAAAVVAVPVRAIAKLGFAPLDVMAILPLALPADLGVNVTVKFALCPAASVTGVDSPLKAKPMPLAAI